MASSMPYPGDPGVGCQPVVCEDGRIDDERLGFLMYSEDYSMWGRFSRMPWAVVVRIKDSLGLSWSDLNWIVGDSECLSRYYDETGRHLPMKYQEHLEGILKTRFVSGYLP